MHNFIDQMNIFLSLSLFSIPSNMKGMEIINSFEEEIMSWLCPKPIRDILTATFQIRSPEVTTLDAEGEVVLVDSSKKIQSADKLIKTTLHTTIAAFGALGISMMGGTITPGIVLSVLSYPSMAIASGCWLVCHGGSTVITAIAANSLTTLAVGLTSLGGGLLALHCYDTPFGLLERHITKFALSHQKFVVKALS